MSKRIVFALISFLLLGAALAGCASNEPLPYTLAPESALPQFIHTTAARVQEAYRFAITNPHELEKYPCYCGCGAMGHTSNLSCYVRDIDAAGNVSFDNHAAGCGICVDITQDVMRLLREGKSSPQIRSYIDAQYSGFGPGTNTPLPAA